MAKAIDEFIAGRSHRRESPPPAFYVDVEGSSLYCQFCDECVSEGKYYPSEKLLVWECSSGHVSSVEDIVL